jgi:hypothetical protein
MRLPLESRTEVQGALIGAGVRRGLAGLGGLGLGGMVVGGGEEGCISKLVSGSGRVKVKHPLLPAEKGEDMAIANLRETES